MLTPIRWWGGAFGEDSAATGINGDQDDNTASGAGAVYVFSRVDGGWAQQAYLRPSNAGLLDGFGASVALSADGNTLVVGATYEEGSGAAHVFSRVDGAWAQQAYLKASNTEADDSFGESVALSVDGNTLVVGAYGEASAETGVDGDQDDNSAPGAGAVYVFSRVDGGWAQQTYLKASNAEASNWFGASVALSADGNTLVVGANREDSAATGVDGDQDDNSAPVAGAIYLY